MLFDEALIERFDTTFLFPDFERKNRNRAMLFDEALIERFDTYFLFPDFEREK